jgi:class 3 adenylate cyclase
VLLFTAILASEQFSSSRKPQVDLSRHVGSRGALMPEERKLVTILFADVTGSTALGESLDPEDVRALMGRYYAHARRVIAEHGGTLEKFIGDAIMAVFGLPRALGNDAERALAAALALREAIATDALLAHRLLLRMGVNTGEVVATSDPAGGDFLVTGDAVNVAARLQQGAAPGEIVLGERTASAAQAAFLFGELRLLEVKGKREPLRVFPLLQARAARDVGRPPLVGRRQDLLHLELLRLRTLEERRPQLVSIVAPVGTGKTRLLEEFLARLDPADGFQVATARCLPYGQSLTYWPLRGLLAELLRGTHDQPELPEAQLSALFAGGGYLPHDAARLSDLVLTTLGIEREGTAERESIFIAWRLLIETLAAQVPHIIVFEDLHWASESLLDLVEHLMHPRTQAPLLLLVLSRPELLDRRPSWGGGRRNFTSLTLEPLSPVQTHELVEGLQAGLPAAIRARIVERSGGNPFFALELVRGLAERRRGAEAPTPTVLPDTVHAAVLARLDLLSARERVVVQAASVAGRAFRPAMLQAMLDEQSPSAIDTALDDLLTRNLIMPAGGDAYTFRHILIRDVAYGTLARAERIRLHSKIAAWLEVYAAERLDEFVELLAYHYREAVQLARQSAVPVAMPLDPARAVHYLERAGEFAGHAGALAEARAYLQSAIDLAPEEERLRLYERLGDALIGWSDTVADAYRKALAQWHTTARRDPLIKVRLVHKLLVTYWRWFLTESSWRVHQEELGGLLAEAHELAEAMGDEDAHWQVRLAGVCWRRQLGKLTMEEAEEQRAVALAAAAHFERRAEWVSFRSGCDCRSARRLGPGTTGDGYRRGGNPRLGGTCCTHARCPCPAERRSDAARTCPTGAGAAGRSPLAPPAGGDRSGTERGRPAEIWEGVAISRRRSLVLPSLDAQEWAVV